VSEVANLKGEPVEKSCPGRISSGTLDGLPNKAFRQAHRGFDFNLGSFSCVIHGDYGRYCACQQIRENKRRQDLRAQ